jgi:hypothetical protein
METGGGEGVVSSLTRLGQDTAALWSPHHHQHDLAGLRDLDLLREEGGATFHHHQPDRGDPHRSTLHHHQQQQQHHHPHGLLWAGATAAAVSPAEGDSNNSSNTTHHILPDAVDLDKEVHQHQQHLYHHLHHHHHHHNDVSSEPPPTAQTPPLLFLEPAKEREEGDSDFLQESSPRPLSLKVVGIPEFLQQERKEEFLGGEKAAADFLGGKMGEEFLEDPEDDDQGEEKETEKIVHLKILDSFRRRGHHY